MQVQSLGQEDPLEQEMATHSSVLAWRIPWTEEPGRLQSIGWQRDTTEVTKQQQLGIGVGIGTGFPGGASGKEPACQGRRCRRLGFDPWLGKIP